MRKIPISVGRQKVTRALTLTFPLPPLTSPMQGEKWVLNRLSVSWSALAGQRAADCSAIKFLTHSIKSAYSGFLDILQAGVQAGNILFIFLSPYKKTREKCEASAVYARLFLPADCILLVFGKLFSMLPHQSFCNRLLNKTPNPCTCFSVPGDFFL